MWNVNEIQSQTLRDAVNKCRNRARISMYRTRNPIDLMDILFPFSFLFVLGARTPEERNRYFGFKTIATPRNVDNNTGVAMLNDELNAMTYDMNFIVVNTINNKEVGDAFYEFLKTVNAVTLDGYTVALTQSPYHRTQLVYEEEAHDGRILKNYYLFTNKMNDVAIARFAGCVCAHMNLYGENTGDIATALLQSNQANYENLITVFAESATVSEFQQQLQNTIEQVGTYGTARIIQRLEREVHSKQNDIQSYMQYLTATYDQIRELQRRILGAQHQTGEESELSQFLSANINNITYAKLHDGYLYMRYRTPMLYWDEDVFKILRESSNDNPLRPTSEVTQWLIDDIFIKRNVVLWFDSGFRYNLVGSGFKQIYMPNEFTDVPSSKGLPNPHHYYYNCWGDNEPRIVQAQSKGDNVIALAQIFAAIAGINLSDSVVLNRFINSMWHDFRNVPCLEVKETNEFISIDTYYRRCREAQRAARTQTQEAQSHPEFPFE